MYTIFQYTPKSLFLSLLFILYAGTTLQAQYSIMGHANVNQNQNYNYSIIDSMWGANIFNVTWTIDHGGTIISQSGAKNTNAIIKWTGQTTGKVIATIQEQSFNSVTIEYTVNINSGPPTPIPPTIQSTNCGNTVLARGNPPSGVTWYWQSSAAGTSTSNSSTTITRNGGAIYYLRARNGAGIWSTNSSSVNYTIKLKPSVPGVPSITNNCGNTVLTKGNAPGGITWYWQNSASDTSISNANTSITRTSGTVYYLRARNNTNGCWSTARPINYSINTVPNTPSTPTITNNCNGSTVLTKGNSPNGITWYWQSSASGTSISNSSPSVTRTSGSVYYLRARNNATECWSTARTINYSVSLPPAVPIAPIVTNNCGSTQLSASPPPSGITYYWQSTPTGTSTSNPGTTVTFTSSGIGLYYIRARDNATECWSAVRTVNYTVNSAPNIPTAPTVTNNCGNTVLTKGDSHSSLTWYWQNSATGTDISNSNPTVTFTSGSGVYYLRSRRNSTGCWSAARTINYAVNTVPETPSAPTITNNCGNTVLTKGSSPSGITWYWQNSASGTSISNSSPSVTRTSGSVYYLRARNNATECWSTARSINYSVSLPPAVPIAPIVTNNCGSTLLSASPPPSGITYYWQSTSTGTSMSNSNATVTFTSSGIGIYYIRARDNATECWSTVRTVNYTVDSVPDIPTAPTITNNCGNTVLTKGDSHSSLTWYWQSSATGTDISNSSPTVTFTSGSGVYYLRSRRNSTGCWSAARTINYAVNTVPETPSAPTITNNCGNTILTKGSAPSGITWYWQNNASGVSTSNSSSSVTHTSGTAYYLRARNNTSGCWSTARTINYTVSQVPTWYADSDGDGYGNISVSQSSCTTPPGYVSNSSDYDDSTIHITNIAPQYFYQDSDGDGFGDPNVSVFYSVMPSGYVTNNTDQCPNEAGPHSGCNFAPTTLSDENYIYTRVYQNPMSDESEINEDSDIIELVTYFDGLGRAKQSIGIKAAPDKKDIITHIGYDDFGRQDKEWLPYPETNGSVGTYRGDKASDTKQYYKTNYASDFTGMVLADINAYSQKDLEASPLSRILKQAAPGKDWKLGNNNEIEFEYKANIVNEVNKYYVTFSNNNTEMPQLALGSPYMTGELYKIITKDENHDGTASKNHTIEEFKNKQGQVILKRTYTNTDTNNDRTDETEVPHDTYYVYDDFGNLTYVIPPKVTTDDGVSPTELAELCYQYKYDYRNRLIEKKVPGKDWEYIIYNNLDQPVLTQDANQRPNKEWLFTKYDAFGRVVYTGIYTHATVINRLDMVTAQNSYYTNNTTEDLFEEKVSSEGNYHYYSNGTFPNTELEVLTVNYYDNYGFNLDGGTNPGGTVTNVKGLATGNKVKVLATNDWITSVNYYDVKGRVIYIYSKNDYLDTIDIVENTLDFVGKVTEITTSHTKGSNPAIITVDKFSYDHVNRLLTQIQQINIQDAERLVHNEYDALGQLIKKDVGGNVTASENEAISSLQEVNYNYNVRGWLKSINEGFTLNGDLFGFAIEYNTGTNPLYNGNISATSWQTANDNVVRSYAYTYDALNRITSGVTNMPDQAYSLKDIKYDMMGNIKSLYRRGPQIHGSNAAVDIDILSYTYDQGNKLQSVIDNAPLTYGGFEDGNKTGDDYTYDDNGNMMLDKNKGITEITYNHLNLPKTVSVSNSEGTGTISYMYDATGVKLKKIVPGGSSFTETEYAGNYIYVNGSLQFFNHPEGYLEPKDENDISQGFEYIYQYMDHLGNIRLSYADANNDGSISVSEIREEKNYYPFGLQHKGYNNTITGREHPYGFGGKEENDELGLEWLDFGARNYDASLGRWMNLDPLANKYYPFSPYNYVANNPIFFIDPDGKDITIPVTGPKGSARDLRHKATILKSLQKLTNRKLTARIVGSNYVVREIKGSSANPNKNLKTGTALIFKLIHSEKTISIKIGKENSTGGPTFKDKEGKGGSNIEVNLTSKDGPVNEDGTKKRNPEIGLAHELIHAETNADGKKNKNKIDVNDPDQKGTDNKIEAEEVPIRDKENKIRDEQDHVLRAKIIVKEN